MHLQLVVTQHETKWFYERARGQYVQSQMHMTKAEKNKFVAQHPKKTSYYQNGFGKNQKHLGRKSSNGK